MTGELRPRSAQLSDRIGTVGQAFAYHEAGHADTEPFKEIDELGEMPIIVEQRIVPAYGTLSGIVGLYVHREDRRSFDGGLKRAGRAICASVRL
jgi:hypothetical protein